jgi:hypothetical protein
MDQQVAYLTVKTVGAVQLSRGYLKYGKGYFEIHVTPYHGTRLTEKTLHQNSLLASQARKGSRPTANISTSTMISNQV